MVAGLAVAALAAAGWLWSVAEARRAELAAAHATNRVYDSMDELAAA